MAATVSVQTRTRPKRVAVLFDLDKVTAIELDGAIVAATECWAGAYFPLVPYRGNEMSPDWWRVIEAVDPDIVFSLHVLPGPLIEELIRRSAPLRILQASEDPSYRQVGRRLIHRDDLNALNTASIPSTLQAARGFGPIGIGFLAPEDRWNELDNRTFALRNFGVLARDARYARSFPDPPYQVWQYADQKSPLDFLQTFPRGELWTPRDMAGALASSPSRPRQDEFSTAFWLVVGESPLDIALAWNSALAHEDHLGRTCIWISEEDATNVKLLEELWQWVDRVFNHRGSGRGFVLSYSIDEATLESIRAKMDRPSACVRFEYRKLEPTSSLFQEYERRKVGLPFKNELDQQVAIHGDVGQSTFVRPPFAPASGWEGGWMVDILIEHEGDPSIYGSSGVWKIPRRPGVAQCFRGSNHRIRVTWEGTPSIEVSGSDTDVRFRVPSAVSVFESCLSPSELSSNGDVVMRRPSSLRMATSTAGLQLNGVIELFGGLWQAGHAFENPFWRDVFTTLAGRPEDIRARQVAAVELALSNEIERAGGQLKLEQVSKVSEPIAEKVWRSEPESRFVQLDQLPDYYNRFVGKYIQKHGPQSYFQEAKYDDWVDNTRDLFIERGVLLQGIQVRCPECFIHLWRHVDELRRRFPCPGCLETISLPSDPKWCVRLNELVGVAIREGGVIPVLHALFKLQSRTSGTFTFIASQDVLSYPEDRKVAELDVLVLRDGQLLVGEVKAHPRGFDEEAVNRAMEIARVMLPDTLMFASETDEFPDRVRKILHSAGSEFSRLGIEVQFLPLQWSRPAQPIKVNLF